MFSFFFWVLCFFCFSLVVSNLPMIFHYFISPSIQGRINNFGLFLENHSENIFLIWVRFSRINFRFVYFRFVHWTCWFFLPKFFWRVWMQFLQIIFIWINTFVAVIDGYSTFFWFRFLRLESIKAYYSSFSGNKFSQNILAKKEAIWQLFNYSNFKQLPWSMPICISGLTTLPRNGNGFWNNFLLSPRCIGTTLIQSCHGTS